MKIERTSRGFTRASFTDRYNNECSIQKSSIATEDCIWLGVDRDAEGKECPTRMHLTKTMVKRLLPHLQHFAESGELK